MSTLGQPWAAGAQLTVWAGAASQLGGEAGTSTGHAVGGRPCFPAPCSPDSGQGSWRATLIPVRRYKERPQANSLMGGKTPSRPLYACTLVLPVDNQQPRSARRPGPELHGTPGTWRCSAGLGQEAPSGTPHVKTSGSVESWGPRGALEESWDRKDRKCEGGNLSKC